MQTRLNVVKKRNAKTIDDTNAYADEMTQLGNTEEGSEAVRLLGKLNAIKADTRQVEASPQSCPCEIHFRKACGLR